MKVMKAKTIAFTNHKGGVGKTTSVFNISYALANRGKRVLVVDMDAQANLTTSLYPREINENIYYSLKEGRRLQPIKVAENLYLIASGEELSTIELEISGRIGREFLLSELLEPIKADYDYILIDCPPSLSLLTLNAFVAADDLIIVLTPEGLPVKGLALITKFIEAIQKRANTSLRLSGVLVTRYEGTNLNKSIIDKLKEKYKEIVFNTRVRKNTDLAECVLSQKSIYDYNPRSNGAADYIAVTDEFLEKIK